MKEMFAKLMLYCPKCRRVRIHIDIKNGPKKGDIGRLVHARCLTCGYRSPLGNVIYEAEE